MLSFYALSVYISAGVVQSLSSHAHSPEEPAVTLSSHIAEPRRVSHPSEAISSGNPLCLRRRICAATRFMLRAGESVVAQEPGALGRHWLDTGSLGKKTSWKSLSR